MEVIEEHPNDLIFRKKYEDARRLDLQSKSKKVLAFSIISPQESTNWNKTFNRQDRTNHPKADPKPATLKGPTTNLLW